MDKISEKKRKKRKKCKNHINYSKVTKVSCWDKLQVRAFIFFLTTSLSIPLSIWERILKTIEMNFMIGIFNSWIWVYFMSPSTLVLHTLRSIFPFWICLKLIVKSQNWMLIKNWHWFKIIVHEYQQILVPSGGSDFGNATLCVC